MTEGVRLNLIVSGLLMLTLPPDANGYAMAANLLYVAVAGWLLYATREPLW